MQQSGRGGDAKKEKLTDLLDDVVIAAHACECKLGQLVWIEFIEF